MEFGDSIPTDKIPPYIKQALRAIKVPDGVSLGLFVVDGPNKQCFFLSNLDDPEDMKVLVNMAAQHLELEHPSDRN